jgi:uncharacterized protein (DUF2062 family)
MPTFSRNTLFALAALFGFGVLAESLVEVLAKHTCWCDFAEPPAVGEVLAALVAGIWAFVFALCVDVPTLLQSIKGRLKGGPTGGQ